MTGEFPSQRASNAEMFPFDDIIMDPPDMWVAVSPFTPYRGGQRVKLTMIESSFIFKITAIVQDGQALAFGGDFVALVIFGIHVYIY